MQPFLRWAGSKRKLLPKLAPFWRDDNLRYVEPFMGSASLYFYLEPRQALLSDINEELVNTFIAVRDHPVAVFNRLQKFHPGRTHYYEVRSAYLSDLAPFDAAARFIYLNRFCFNGLYRTNSSGKFNVPYSPAKTGSLPTKEKLQAISKRLRSTTIIPADYATILNAHVGKHDFVYMDPPYAVENRRIFKQYGPQVFGRDDLEHLAELLHAISRKEARFLLTYAYSTEALRLFRAWSTKRVYTQRNIAGFATHRKKACELLVTNIE